MAVDEVRAQLRRRLAEEYGMDEADLLLDRPPGGWDDLVTKEWLHLELGALEARMDARFADVHARFAQIDAGFAQIDERFRTSDGALGKIEARLDTIARELRAQTWRLVTVLIAAMGVVVAAGKL